jgi:nucleoside-diphosphate-sugar epimerase
MMDMDELNTLLSKEFENMYRLNINWEKFKNKVILITGATGFIGSLLIRYMIFLNKEYSLDINIIGLVRNKEKAKDMYADVKLHIVSGDICKNDVLDIFASIKKIDYIFHCAATTRSRDMVEHPVEVAEGIVNGTQNIIKLGKIKQAESIVYISSMEVYGAIDYKDEEVSVVKEENLGYVDTLNPRSCYPLGKRMAENICYSYYIEYGIPIKIARLAQVFGVGILSDENRVFAQFANAVRKGEDIVLHTKGNSMGNYCYSMDAIGALIILLLDGVNGEAYNIVNESATMKIKEMAQLVVENIADGSIKVRYDIPDENVYGYALETGLRLSSAKMQRLGWRPKTEMKEMYSKMIAWMDEIMF